ncbi:MAG: hypothetical protein ABEH81_15920 [Halopenitus sp.]
MSVQTDPLSDGIDVLNGSRYDWLLVAIPIPLLVGWAVSAALSVALPVGLGVGALPAAGLVLYALFVDAPVVGTGSEPGYTDDLAVDPGDSTEFEATYGFDATDGDPATGPVPGSDD